MLKVYYDDVDLLRIESSLENLNVLEDVNDLTLIGTHKLDSVYEHGFKTKPLEVGASITYKGIDYPVIFRGMVKKDEFLNKYDATKERLGAYVENDETTFAVYSPVAASISVLLDEKEYPMTKKENGVFHTTLDMNAHGLSYLYKVNIYGEEKTTTDPYAFASGPNRSYSTVVDLNKLNFDIAPLNQKDDPIILEASVRDFSMDPNIPFENRGKFLGMLESHGDYGMKHVLDLGITHLQLMPVNDFETVDELNPFDSYNWGYDTMQFMSLEGSYSTDVHQPIKAMEEFATLVDAYHKENIGINIDVVFNHIYEVEDHPFNVLVPYYY
ncbi:MAG TPA: alpha-amylase family glycosyl hydrolase, partial [Erysipelothrix sp.]|nr:alpha-amylase family glycosyl hydrolase [Erysipelothrix sp.]